MKQMINFDLELILQNKNNCMFLTMLQLIYVLVGIIFYHKFLFLGLMATLIVAVVNTFVLMATICCHTSSNYLSLSNYASCVYFPVKRRNFYVTKLVFTGCILCYQCILTIAVLCLTNGIHRRPLSAEFVLLNVFGIFLAVLFCSSIATISCFSGRAFQIGTILCFTFVGGMIGGFSSVYGFHERELPKISTQFTIVSILIAVVVWLIANIIAQLIAKRVSV